MAWESISFSLDVNIEEDIILNRCLAYSILCSCIIIAFFDDRFSTIQNTTSVVAFCKHKQKRQVLLVFFALLLNIFIPRIYQQKDLYPPQAFLPLVGLGRVHLRLQ